MKDEGRVPSQVITDAVNEQYGYDLFSNVGDDVIVALAEAGYAITPAVESS